MTTAAALLFVVAGLGYAISNRQDTSNVANNDGDTVEPTLAIDQDATEDGSADSAVPLHMQSLNEEELAIDGFDVFFEEYRTARVNGDAEALYNLSDVCEFELAERGDGGSSTVPDGHGVERYLELAPFGTTNEGQVDVECHASYVNFPNEFEWHDDLAKANEIALFANPNTTSGVEVLGTYTGEAPEYWTHTTIQRATDFLGLEIDQTKFRAYRSSARYPGEDFDREEYVVFAMIEGEWKYIATDLRWLDDVYGDDDEVSGNSDSVIDAEFDEDGNLVPPTTTSVEQAAAEVAFDAAVLAEARDLSGQELVDFLTTVSTADLEFMTDVVDEATLLAAAEAELARR